MKIITSIIIAQAVCCKETPLTKYTASSLHLSYVIIIILDLATVGQYNNTVKNMCSEVFDER